MPTLYLTLFKMPINRETEEISNLNRVYMSHEEIECEDENVVKKIEEVSKIAAKKNQINQGLWKYNKEHHGRAYETINQYLLLTKNPNNENQTS